MAVAVVLVVVEVSCVGPFAGQVRASIWCLFLLTLLGVLALVPLSFEPAPGPSPE